MKKVLAIAGLDLLRASRSRSLWVEGAIMPLIMTLLVSMGFGFGTDGAKPADTIAYVDLSASRFSGEVIRWLEEIPSLKLVQASEEKLESMVRDEKVSLGVIFPAGFEEDILAGRGVQVKVVSLDTAEVRPGEVYLETALRRLEAGVIAARAATGMLQDDASSSAEPGASTGPGAGQVWNEIYEGVVKRLASPPVSVKATVSGAGASEGRSPELSGKNYSSLGFLVMFVGMTMLSMLSTSFVVDREESTLARLLTTRVRASEVAAGKVLAVLAAGAMSAIILMGFGSLIGVPWASNLPGATLMLAAYLLCMSALALVVAVFSRTRAQAAAASTLVSVIGAMLGGCWWPLEIVPPFMRGFAYVTPFGWAMMGISAAVNRGRSLREIAGYIASLLAFAVVFFGVGAWKIRRESGAA